MAHDRLAHWLKRRGRGALNTLAQKAQPLSLNTVRKAVEEPVELRAALLISRGTDWEVPIWDLTDDVAGLDAISEMPARQQRRPPARRSA